MARRPPRRSSSPCRCRCRHGQPGEQLDLAGCRGAHRRPDRGAQLDHRVRQLPAAGRATTARINEIHAERSGIELAARRTGRCPAAHPPTSWPAARPTAPNHCWPAPTTVGVQGAARRGGGRPQERSAQGGRRDLQPRTRHRHGAVDLVIQVEARRRWPAACSASAAPATRWARSPAACCSQTPHRPDRLRGQRAAHAGRPDRDDAGANPLDVLAQHTVAACALEPLSADVWFDVVRRSAPFATPPRSAFEATLDLLSGKYPSTDFAELRPRLVYDRDTGTLTARPARSGWPSPPAAPSRTAGCSPSTWPPVRKALAGRRTRRGDGLRVAARRCHLTGRHQLAHHRDHPRPVLVVPAPGQPARLPFWRGDDAGRPPNWARPSARSPANWPGWTAMPSTNTLCGAGFRGLRRRQPVAAARRPAHRHQDRAQRHHAAGRTVPRRAGRLAGGAALPVRAEGARPLALAVGRRLLERYGIDEKPTASDDGIVVRLPDTEDSRPGQTCSCSSPTRSSRWSPEGRRIGPVRLPVPGVRGAGAAAARRHPGKRSPLWHQRQRASQLLDVARRYPDFPIVLETVRECLQDVYDVPTLTELMARIAQRRVRVLEVETRRRRRSRPRCCSATSGVHVRGRQPAGRTPRRRAFSLDSTLLAELLGGSSCASCSTRRVIAATARQLQHLSEDRRARDAEGVADLLRLLGPLTEEEIARSAAPRRTWARGWTVCTAAKRVLPVCRTRAGRGGWASRTSAGCATPSGSPFRSGCPPGSPRRCPTRWANCWAAMRAPAGRSPPVRPPPDSGWAAGGR